MILTLHDTAATFLTCIFYNVNEYSYLEQKDVFSKCSFEKLLKCVYCSCLFCLKWQPFQGKTISSNVEMLSAQIIELNNCKKNVSTSLIVIYFPQTNDF